MIYSARAMSVGMTLRTILSHTSSPRASSYNTRYGGRIQLSPVISMAEVTVSLMHRINFSGSCNAMASSAIQGAYHPLVMISCRVMTGMTAFTSLNCTGAPLTSGDCSYNFASITLVARNTTIIVIQFVEVDDIGHGGHRPVTTCTACCSTNIIMVSDGAVSCGMALCTILRYACRTLTGGNHTRYRGRNELGAGIGMTQCTICSMQAIDRRGGCYPMTVGTI